MAKLELKNVSKTYKGKIHAVKNLSFKCEDGEFLAILGPSGCGKSSTLRMIAGLESITSGYIKISEDIVNDKSPSERKIAMAFETYALYPTMSVYENIAFPLRVAKIPEEGVKKRVKKVIDLVEIDKKILYKRGRSLGGGQMQQVGLARALVKEPAVFLLDEPISHLDAQHRGRLRTKIRDLQIKLGITMVYVTHDQLEAMTMADRIIIMDYGEIQQFGTPEEIYNQPASTFVAGFIGDPPMNMFESKIIAKDEKIYLDGEGFNILVISQKPKEKIIKFANNDEKRYIVGVRPERVIVSKKYNEGMTPCIVKTKEYLGDEILLGMQIGNKRIYSSALNTKEFVEGEKIFISLKSENICLFNKKDGKRAI